MNKPTTYRVDAAIDGAVQFRPGPLSMRHDDTQTPTLDIWLAQYTYDRKKRPFVLTDWEIRLETVTPGKVIKIFSSEKDDCFEIIMPKDGHFLLHFPQVCKDAVGESGLTYLRLAKDGAVRSTHNFKYRVYEDICNTGNPGGDGTGGGDSGGADEYSIYAASPSTMNIIRGSWDMTSQRVECV